MKKLMLIVALLASTSAQGEVLSPPIAKAMSMRAGKAYLMCAKSAWEARLPEGRLLTEGEAKKMVYDIALQCEVQWDRLAGVQETFAYVVREEFEQEFVWRFVQ